MKVLIVDDSPLVRSILINVLSDHEDIHVVGGAKDPFEARELIIEFRPDVIILDIAMPRMDGLTFLKKLMAHYPVPVIMCSGMAPANSHAALEAIESGAVDVVAKPDRGGSVALRRLGEELADKIHAAAVALPAPPAIPVSASAAPTSFHSVGLDPRRYLIVIGASTGGTEAIRTLLSHVPADWPPVAIVQHMPEGFTDSFAKRLDEFSRLTVTEAVDGDVLVPGRALLARGGIQMSVHSGGGQWRLRYGSDEPVNRHCPSVDVLFDSVVNTRGRQIVGILLTGMGADGAHGLLRLRQAGAITIGQDQRSCVVYGMPKVAADIGAVQHVGPPAEIPRTVLRLLQEVGSRKTASAQA
ncbi:MAG: chemotaxis response regulator protein-glutamate methylesterase [bacterium]|nr:chemotaxis response regulator protein-glutamate methylesterase [bacterium]